MNHWNGPMPYVDVPAEYHVTGSHEPYIEHAYVVFGRFRRDTCIGACPHPYRRLRRSVDGALWDGAGGSPIGFTPDEMPTLTRKHAMQDFR